MKEICIIQYIISDNECRQCNCYDTIFTKIDATGWVEVSDEDYITLVSGLYNINKGTCRYQLIEKPRYNGNHEEFIRCCLSDIKEAIAKEEKRKIKEQEEYKKKNKVKLEKAAKKKALKDALKSIPESKLLEIIKENTNAKID